MPGFPRKIPGKSYSARSPENNFVDSFFEFAWEFSTEKWRRFLAFFFFLVSVSHETKRENSSQIRSKLGAKFGTELREIQGTSVLQLL